MIRKIWNGIKSIPSMALNFFKRHFHKAVAVIGAGLVMCTFEIFGLYAADVLLLPFAMTSLIGLIALCFSYFLIIFTAITIGMEVFNVLWNVCQLDTTDTDEIETTAAHPRAIELAAATAAVCSHG
ncbi:MAG TPA: hypothetical protein VI911_10815 [Patescibacteria group bacterium]|nr:hypothetical protein [Patescibacteria group bacterium]